MKETTGGALREARGTTDSEHLRALYEEVVAGLSQAPRRLPAKLLYDDRGARLFEAITRTDAYYPTRLEIGILERGLPEVRDRMGAGTRVVEFGTGDGRKTALLLEALDRPAACIPIDISRRQLLEFASDLRRRFPTVEILPLAADYTRPFDLPTPGSGAPGRVLVFFPGSTIGNFEPARAESFLRTVRRSAASGAKEPPRLLVGVDLVKSAPVLRRAYNDPEGWTAAFNRNTLRHVNRLFNGDFRVESFDHRAIWNPESSRIEMHLVSGTRHDVTLAPELPGARAFHFELAPGEPVVTEHSYKYDLDTFEILCGRAGWRTLRSWTDPDGWFAVRLLEADT